MALPLEGDRRPIAVVKTKFNQSTGAISPDGRWVAFSSDESGRFELYVQAFPGIGPSGRWQISDSTGFDVGWRGDGKELYYQATDKRIMAVAIQAGPDGIRHEPPRVLFSADFLGGALGQFDVTSNGQRFLLAIQQSQTNAIPLTVVFNWQAALRH